jgi:Amt family ammonium transporter
MVRTTGAYAEAVHGYQPSRRPTLFGDLGLAAPRPEQDEEG